MRKRPTQIHKGDAEIAASSKNRRRALRRENVDHPRPLLHQNSPPGLVFDLSQGDCWNSCKLHALPNYAKRTRPEQKGSEGTRRRSDFVERDTGQLS